MQHEEWYDFSCRAPSSIARNWSTPPSTVQKVQQRKERKTRLRHLPQLRLRNSRPGCALKKSYRRKGLNPYLTMLGPPCRQGFIRCCLMLLQLSTPRIMDQQRARHSMVKQVDLNRYTDFCLRFTTYSRFSRPVVPSSFRTNVRILMVIMLPRMKILPKSQGNMWTMCGILQKRLYSKATMALATYRVQKQLLRLVALR